MNNRVDQFELLGLSASQIQQKLEAITVTAKNIHLITTPLSGNANEAGTLYTTAIANADPSKHIIAALTGEGITEGHVTTLYSPPVSAGKSREYFIFDSKTSDVEALLNSPNTENNGTTRKFDLGKIIKGLFRNFFNPAYETTLTDKNITYISLGTQSFFDPVSCGYHTIENIKNIIQMIQANTPVNRANLLSQPITIDITGGAGQSLSFATVVQQAFERTYPTISLGQGLLARLMGWPATSGWLGKAAYLLLGGWIVRPLVNLIKALTELPVTFIMESSRYARWRLFNTAPTSTSSQYARGLAAMLIYAVEGVSIAARTVIRTVTAPIDNAKELWAIHPALGVCSMAASACAYFALTVFAAPLMTTIGAHIGASSVLSALSSLPIVSNIVTPALTVLQQLGITGAAGITGALALTTAASGMTVANGTREVITENAADIAASCNGSTRHLCCFLPQTNNAFHEDENFVLLDDNTNNNTNNNTNDNTYTTDSHASDARRQGLRIQS